MSDLGFNPPVLLTQLISFIILFGLLYVAAYKPLMRMLDERATRVKESLEQAETVKQQAASAGDEIKRQLAQAAREAQERLARVEKTGEDLKQKARENARKEAEALLARARSEIHQERDQAIDELRREFADLTILAAGKVIDRSLDKAAHRELVQKVLEESSSLKKD
jgi:F-type H+-transporting ATPase subunit b